MQDHALSKDELCELSQLGHILQHAGEVLTAATKCGAQLLAHCCWQTSPQMGRPATKLAEMLWHVTELFPRMRADCKAIAVPVLVQGAGCTREQLTEALSAPSTQSLLLHWQKASAWPAWPPPCIERRQVAPPGLRQHLGSGYRASSLPSHWGTALAWTAVAFGAGLKACHSTPLCCYTGTVLLPAGASHTVGLWGVALPRLRQHPGWQAGGA